MLQFYAFRKLHLKTDLVQNNENIEGHFFTERCGSKRKTFGNREIAVWPKDKGAVRSYRLLGVKPKAPREEELIEGRGCCGDLCPKEKEESGISPTRVPKANPIPTSPSQIIPYFPTSSQTSSCSCPLYFSKRLDLSASSLGLYSTYNV
jgi:hypothetical protein